MWNVGQPWFIGSALPSLEGGTKIPKLKAGRVPGGTSGPALCLLYDCFVVGRFRACNFSLGGLGGAGLWIKPSDFPAVEVLNGGGIPD